MLAYDTMGGTSVGPMTVSSKQMRCCIELFLGVSNIMDITFKTGGAPINIRRNFSRNAAPKKKKKKLIKKEIPAGVLRITRTIFHVPKQRMGPRTMKQYAVI